MNSTIPADILELNTRFETWRTNRKYVRAPIPDELWNAARCSEARASGPFCLFQARLPQAHNQSAEGLLNIYAAEESAQVKISRGQRLM